MIKTFAAGVAAWTLAACAAAPTAMEAMDGAPGDEAMAVAESLAGADASRPSAVSLLDADRAFAARAADVGPARAFREFMTEDAVVLPTGSQARRGRAAILELMADFPDGGELTWAPERAHLAAAGDMGFTWGRYTLVVPAGVQERLMTGSYATVWRRDRGGRWRVILATGNK